MCPDLVGLKVGRVEIGLGGIKDHSVNASVGRILVVLNILFERTLLVYGEDVTVTSVFVERIAVDVVRGLMSSQDEDGAGVGVGAGREGYKYSAKKSKRSRGGARGKRTYGDQQQDAMLDEQSRLDSSQQNCSTSSSQHHKWPSYHGKKSSMKLVQPLEYRSS